MGALFRSYYCRLGISNYVTTVLFLPIFAALGAFFGREIIGKKGRIFEDFLGISGEKKEDFVP